MADMITPNFSVNEMACRCGCGLYEMDEEFIRLLQILRDEMQGLLRVTSGRRCDTHNFRVSTAQNKQNGIHTKGKAADILVSGERAMKLFEKARQIGFSGIGLSRKSGTPHLQRFIHLDTKPKHGLGGVIKAPA